MRNKNVSLSAILSERAVVYKVKASAMLVGVLSASASLGRFTECMESGFRIHEVSSTPEHVVVELAKGDERVTVKMGPEDARSLLGLERAKKTRRMAAGHAP